ncbi:hypothetical protein BV003_01135 [Haemophilus influenzae]|nr:hypothetical protein BV012_00211 [Haemophilus influenzae]PRM12025.1 hypothetical protein BV003_01135 [Haemophilus influenzae]PRM82248.1 hypothetical protein BV161_01461 [Haemophilus influenzae]
MVKSLLILKASSPRTWEFKVKLAPLEILISLIFNSAPLPEWLAYISKKTEPPPVAVILAKNRIGKGLLVFMFSFGFNLKLTFAPSLRLNDMLPFTPLKFTPAELLRCVVKPLLLLEMYLIKVKFAPVSRLRALTFQCES